MRFPRQAKIFRGQLDAAPLVSVFFLLVVFVILGSLLYTPGLALNLTSPAQFDQALRFPSVVTVTRDGQMLFDKRKYKLDELEQLRADLKGLTDRSVLVVRADPEAPRELIIRLREMAGDLNLQFEIPVRLPDPFSGKTSLLDQEYLSGTGNPTIAVAVNFSGQLYFENQLIDESELKTRLLAVTRKSKLPVTLILLADKSVENEVTTRLGELAQQAGIKQLVIATRPRVFSPETRP